MDAGEKPERPGAAVLAAPGLNRRRVLFLVSGMRRTYNLFCFFLDKRNNWCYISVVIR